MSDKFEILLDIADTACITFLCEMALHELKCL